MTLCRVCEDFSFEKVLQRPFRHHHSVEALQISAEGGCTLCSLIFEAFSKEYERNKQKQIDTNGEVWINKYKLHEQGNTLNPEQNLVCRTGEGKDAVDIYISLETSSDDLAAEYITARPLRLDLSDEGRLELIHQWLDECTKQHDHPDCQDNSATLPTRILDVGPADGSREPFLFKTNGEIGKYLTLSYCWGSSGSNLKTMVGNFEAHTKEIKYASLPKTIQQAVDITRGLKFRYLWVDALCIIQDHLKDWTLEFPKMAQIYGSSFLTIAAESASDCSEGMPKRPLTTEVKKDYFVRNGVPCGSVTMTLNDQLHNVHGPLRSRGWAFQERVFSRRILTYAPYVLRYTCRESSGSERDGLTNLTSTEASLIGELPSPIFRLEHASLEDILDYWYGAIEDYSDKNLTYQSDKFPAISGLAHEIGKLVQSSYQAGLWENDLVYGLLWRTENRPLRKATPSRVEGRAPSWSWASLDAGVYWAYSNNRVRSGQLRVTSLTVVTYLLQDDPMGEISGGLLSLEGSLRAARWVPKASIFFEPQQFHMGLYKFEEVLLEVDVPKTNQSTTQLVHGQESGPSLSANGSGTRFFAICKFDDDTDRPPYVWCLLVTSEFDLDAQSTQTQKLSEVQVPGKGIMLVSTESGNHNEYRRVGYFELDGEQKDWPTTLTKITIV